MKMNKNVKKLKNQKGFTLIEMVIVIAIVVMLLIIIAPNLVHQKQNAQSRTDEAFVTTLQTQVEVYNDDHPKDKLKDSLAPLADGDNYLTEKQKKNLDNYRLENGKVVSKK